MGASIVYRLRAVTGGVVLIMLLLSIPATAVDREALWALLQSGGQVVVMRHAATEPGVGDPPGFRLDDCRTQRNLSAAGREEARRITHGTHGERPWAVERLESIPTLPART